MNIVSLIHRAARGAGDAPAVADPHRELTRTELFCASAAVAAALPGLGIKPGDRVGLLMHNQADWLIAALGCWQAGAVLVPLNYLASPNALRHIVVDANVRVIICSARDADRAREAGGGTIAILTDRQLTALVASRHGPGVVASRLNGDDALIMYTSGSTGVPKGVRQTHRNLAAIAEAEIVAWNLGPTDRALVCTPLFHVGGLQLLALPMLLAGGPIRLRRWDAEGWLSDVAAWGATVVALVPAMMTDVLTALAGRPRPLPGVRVCAVGGSALPTAKLAQFTDATGIEPINIYGQTEQNGVSIAQPLDEPRRAGALGRPLTQGISIRLCDTQTQRDVPAGTVGEIWVRGDTVSPGYWNLPQLDAERRADGWLRTGDLAVKDADGYLYYRERADDLIISGGENIHPQAIIDELAGCPHVAELAVLGTPDDRLGEIVTAVIVPSSAGVTVAAIVEYCRKNPNLQGLQRPRRIELVGQIPRTATDKVDRQALRRRLAAAAPE